MKSFWSKFLFGATLLVALYSGLYIVNDLYNKSKQIPLVTGTVLDIDQKEKSCVVEALWHESRGESPEGIKAVLSVIHNRVKTKGYPATYCNVIKQDRQFSYRQKQSLKVKPAPAEKHKLVLIETLAEQAVTDTFKPTLPKTVLWYTTHKVNNYWTRTKQVVAKVGSHKFMKDKQS